VWGAIVLLSARRGLFAAFSCLAHHRPFISGGFYLKVSEAGFKTQVAFPEIDIPSSYECLRRHDKN
jgi:hypothetical protein